MNIYYSIHNNEGLNFPIASKQQKRKSDALPTVIIPTIPSAASSYRIIISSRYIYLKSHNKYILRVWKHKFQTLFF